jgi:3-phenylpropionate/trans-cinnamate dioxygenase ferredoxin reductase component
LKRYPYVIVGASIAGLSAIGAIRSRDPVGTIFLIHGEKPLPYKRTQLSKQLVRGFSGDELAIYPREWYLANKVELLQGIRAISFEPSSRELSLGTGDIVGYDSLLVSTGAEPTILDIPGTEHLCYLRRIDQAETIRRRVREIDTAVSIGFGVQSLELADQFVSAGLATTLIGCQDALMDSHIDLEASQRLEKRIVAAGVSVLRWGKILEVHRTGSKYRVGVEGGEKVTEIVCASVGATSTTDFAASARVPLQNDNRHGVKVERDMRTGIEGVFAAGDCTAALPGASWGLWHSAQHAGTIAGINMAHGDLHPEPRPHRLKCEAFSGYLFSLNYRNVLLDKMAESLVLRNTPSLYLRVWQRDGRSAGAVLDMYPNPGQPITKPLGKSLEQLILDGASAQDIPEALRV